SIEEWAQSVSPALASGVLGSIGICTYPNCDDAGGYCNRDDVKRDTLEFEWRYNTDPETFEFLNWFKNGPYNRRRVVGVSASRNAAKVSVDFGSGFLAEAATTKRVALLLMRGDKPASDAAVQLVESWLLAFDPNGTFCKFSSAVALAVHLLRVIGANESPLDVCWNGRSSTGLITVLSVAACVAEATRQGFLKSRSFLGAFRDVFSAFVHTDDDGQQALVAHVVRWAIVANNPKSDLSWATNVFVAQMPSSASSRIRQLVGTFFGRGEVDEAHRVAHVECVRDLCVNSEYILRSRAWLPFVNAAATVRFAVPRSEALLPHWFVAAATVRALRKRLSSRIRAAVACVMRNGPQDPHNYVSLQLLLALMIGRVEDCGDKVAFVTAMRTAPVHDPLFVVADTPLLLNTILATTSTTAATPQVVANQLIFIIEESVGEMRVFNPNATRHVDRTRCRSSREILAALLGGSIIWGDEKLGHFVAKHAIRLFKRVNGDDATKELAAEIHRASAEPVADQDAIRRLVLDADVEMTQQASLWCIAQAHLITVSSRKRFIEWRAVWRAVRARRNIVRLYETRVRSTATALATRWRAKGRAARAYHNIHHIYDARATAAVAARVAHVRRGHAALERERRQAAEARHRAEEARTEKEARAASRAAEAKRRAHQEASAASLAAVVAANETRAVAREATLAARAQLAHKTE
ncbi:MAG: hypothetical protein ACKVK4_08245, partial [Flavobacteriales bacterium]